MMKDKKFAVNLTAREIGFLKSTIVRRKADLISARQLAGLYDTQSLDAALATLDRIGAALDRTIESFGSAANG